MLDDALPPFTPVSAVGEFGLIDRLCQLFGPNKDADITQGIGDDAAVFRAADGQSWVWTTDLLTQGIHFDPSYVPLQHLGFKALSVNASDIYAMNARPRFALVALAVDEHYSVEAIEMLYLGLREACRQYGIELVGGDTTASRTGMTISITVLGTAAPEAIVYRSGAQVNDLLCVTGDLGAAYAGLQILEREKAVWKANPDIQPDISAFAYVVERQLRPQARRDVYEWLAAAGLQPSSMIDVSDGLASEVHHLCEASKVGAVVYHNRLPIEYQTQEAAEAFGLNAASFALHGGEDYELLFTLPVSAHELISRMQEITVIGHITERENGLQLVLPDESVVSLDALGFDHFSGSGFEEKEA